MISREFRVVMADDSSTYVTLTYYGEADPWALHMSFYGSDDNWVFARDTLIHGLNRHAGMGDVRVWSSGRFVHMMLDSPDGTCLLRFFRIQVRQFVDDILELVMPGQESINMDDVISEIFKKEAR